MTICQHDKMPQVHLVNFLSQLWNQSFLQWALVLISGEWHLETIFWILGVVIATGLSLLLELFSGQSLDVYIYFCCCCFLCFFFLLVFWPWGMWDLSSPTRDRTRIPCTGRRSLNHWTARELPRCIFLKEGRIMSSY